MATKRVKSIAFEKLWKSPVPSGGVFGFGEECKTMDG
jgi:hypothetical protein